MRRQDYVWAKQAVADLRFAFENIERRAGNLMLFESGNERGFLNHWPA